MHGKFFLQLPPGPLPQSPGFAAVHSLCPCDYGGMWVIVAQAAALMGFNTGAFFFSFGRMGSSRQVVTWQRAKRSDKYYSASRADRCNHSMPCTRALGRPPRLTCIKNRIRAVSLSLSPLCKKFVKLKRCIVSPN